MIRVVQPARVSAVPRRSPRAGIVLSFLEVLEDRAAVWLSVTDGATFASWASGGGYGFKLPRIARVSPPKRPFRLVCGATGSRIPRWSRVALVDRLRRHRHRRPAAPS